MKSKEAFKKIKNIKLNHVEYFDDDDYYDNDSIDSYEEYDGTIEENYHDEIQAIEKDLKAFEIIKEKRVDVYYFMSCETLKEYNEDALSHYGIYDVDADQRMLTQEKFDLLKEVLL